jgi:hypothetical protein
VNSLEVDDTVESMILACFTETKEKMSQMGQELMFYSILIDSGWMDLISKCREGFFEVEDELLHNGLMEIDVT